jgi:hypothetical protein
MLHSGHGYCFVITNAESAAGDLDTLTSIGVLLTPRSDGYREWDTTMMAIAGDPELTEEELHNSRALWNAPR